MAVWSTLCGLARDLDGAVVLGDEDGLHAGADQRFHRRVEPDLALRIGEADQRRGVVGHHRVAEARAFEWLLLGGVDFAAVEIEQLGIDRAQARLARGVDDDARDQLVGEHQLHLVAAHDARQLGILPVADLGGDLVSRLAPARVVDQRQDRS